jgi:hypothetical protein
MVGGQSTDPWNEACVIRGRQEHACRWKRATIVAAVSLTAASAAQENAFSNMDLYLSLDGSEVWRDVPAFSSGRGVHSGGRVRFIDIATELEAAKLGSE